MKKQLTDEEKEQEEMEKMVGGDMIWTKDKIEALEEEQ